MRTINSSCGPRIQSAEPSPLIIVKNAGSTVSVTFPRNPSLPLDFIHVEWNDTMASWQRSNVGYVTFTDPGGRSWITATVYPDAPRKALYLRLAAGL